jgi:proteic killer suppression protein
VIRSFRDKDTGKVFRGVFTRRFHAIRRTAQRKLFYVDRAKTLNDLRSPGNSLEALQRDRIGQHTIRINDQYRVCFTWRDGDAYDVEIVDYR